MAILYLRVITTISKRPRVRVLAVNEHGEILLIKTIISSDNRWSLPGGGINRRETAKQAARREFFEETGADVPVLSFEQSQVVQKSTSAKQYFTALVFTVTIKKQDIPEVPYNLAEIKEIGWFSPDALPDDTSRLVGIALRGSARSGTIK